MPFFLNTSNPVSLLFAVSNFYEEYSNRLLKNSIISAMEEFIKSDCKVFTLVEADNNLFSIFLNDVKEGFKKEKHKIAVIEREKIVDEIVKLVSKNHVSFVSFKDAINNEFLRFAVVQTKGSLELPQIISFFVNKHKIDGIIALGVVKKGATDHDKYVTQECMRGLSKISLKTSIPLTSGIISSSEDNIIEERVNDSGLNVGGQATTSCINLIFAKRKIETFFN